MGQQARSTEIFAREQVTVCFLQVTAAVRSEKQIINFKIRSMMPSTEYVLQQSWSTASLKTSFS